MKLEQAILEEDTIKVEKIIKESLNENPKDIQLWIKLSLTELQFPFEDYESALQCLIQVYNIDSDNLDAIILETGIKWHSFGFIEEDLFKRLTKVRCSDSKKMAIIYYIQSLYYQYNNDKINEKIVLQKSIKSYNGFVYPYKALSQISSSELKFKESKELLKKAISNVQKIYQLDEVYDFTDIDTYIAEFITGTSMSYSNFEEMKQLI